MIYLALLLESRDFSGIRGDFVKVWAVLEDVGSVSGHVGSGLSGIGSLFGHVGALLRAVSAV